MITPHLLYKYLLINSNENNYAGNVPNIYHLKAFFRQNLKTPSWPRRPGFSSCTKLSSSGYTQTNIFLKLRENTTRQDKKNNPDGVFHYKHHPAIFSYGVYTN